MKISRVEQKGTKVLAYDENDEELFKKSGECIFFVDDYALIRRGNKICKLDPYGYVLDPNFVLTIGRVRYNDTEVSVYDEEDHELFSKPGAYLSFTNDEVRIRQEDKISVFNPYGVLIRTETPRVETPNTKKSMGCLGWLMLILVGLAIIIGIAYCSAKQYTENQSTRHVFTKDYNQRAQAFHDAMDLFTRQDYKQALERFEWLAQIKYRPAFSSYMAGQCAYKEKRYQEAIKFYKQSLAIKEQASYTSILLENLANAYKALKDEKHYTHYKHLLEQQKTQN
ncbi:tetratricopeptide repeat protein [Helicobacter sp. L8]|uniref:tetratricopeptide repeat protein n=1 Tax=Helicobacter sp. L8 TaxID=2316078 RepID=UPI000EB0DBD5|nr:tetratricopeptide repeat protein [Helicobacter sp. L8]